MRALARTFAIPLVFLAAALVVGLVAIGDHWWKQQRIDRAELAEWYCRHDGTECNGPVWRTLEAHWQDRQVAYEVAVGALFLAAVASGAGGARKLRTGGVAEEEPPGGGSS
jgi:hypothetical protein